MNLNDALELKAQILKSQDEATKKLHELENTIRAAAIRPEKEILEEIDFHEKEIALLEETIISRKTELLLGKFYKNELDKVTFREASWLTGFKEMSLRAMANPKRANAIRVVKEGTTSFITTESLKRYIK